MTTDGAHPHPSLATKADIAALDARIAALEHATPPPPTALHYPMVWPLTALPTPASTVAYTDLQQARNALAAGNVELVIPASGTSPVTIDLGGIPLAADGANVIFRADGPGAILRNGGIYAHNERAIIDNFESQNPQPGQYDDSFRAEGPDADNVLFVRCSAADSGDECLDIWGGRWPTPRRVAVLACRLGFGPRRQDNKPYAMIIGYDAPTPMGVGLYVGVYETEMSGGFRNPFLNGSTARAFEGPYLYMALCAVPGWNIAGVAAINGATMYLDRNTFGERVNRPTFAHIANAATGGTEKDPTVAIATSGNVYPAGITPDPIAWQPSKVAVLPPAYRPGVRPPGTTLPATVAGRGSQDRRTA